MTIEEANSELFAWVFLPDHSHIILKQGDKNFSDLMRLFKLRVNYHFQKKSIWQKRFWEHRIRNDWDLIRHVDYIHNNPVKHGLVKNPIDYPYSSFSMFVDKGIYPVDWASDIDLIKTGEAEQR